MLQVTDVSLRFGDRKPVCESISPDKIFKKVDLPAPFAPISP
jgi:hypothetical protein